jgi:hypothetical protein
MSGIGPVGLYCHDSKPMVSDEAASNRGASVVELGGAMSGLPQQHNLGIGKAVEHSPESLLVVERRQRLRSTCHSAVQVVIAIRS